MLLRHTYKSEKTYFWTEGGDSLYSVFLIECQKGWISQKSRNATVLVSPEVSVTQLARTAACMHVADIIDTLDIK